MLRSSLVMALVATACENFDAQSDVDPSLHDADPGDADSGPRGGDTDPPVDKDRDGFPLGDDCDDDDASTYPGAPELCDGKDNDCSGAAEGEGDDDGDALLDCADYCPVYASPGAGGDGTRARPLSTVQEAIDLAGSSACLEARAFPGTYEESIDFGGYEVNLESTDGAEATTLSGDPGMSVVSFVSGEVTARIYGFTITGGGGARGAGVNVEASSPTLEANWILDNVADVDPYLGGGIRSYNGSPQILDNAIAGNDAGYGGPETGSDGGGINVRGGAPLIDGNLIVDNTAGDGGGIWIAYSDATISHNWISGNAAYDVAGDDPETLDAGGQGGGIDVQIAGATGLAIVNNLITDNSASTMGGGIVTYEWNEGFGFTVIANNVIAFNEVLDTDWGAGFTQWRYTEPVAYNNIVYGNLGVGIYAEQSMDTFSWTYNDVYGNLEDFGGMFEQSGTGNFSADPMFSAASSNADWSDDDFTLRSGSPCVDAGDPGIVDADGSRSDVGGFGGPNGSWP